MKNIYLKIKHYWQQHKILSIIYILILCGAAYFVYAKVTATGSKTSYVFGRVQKGDLVVTVEGTGQVQTVSEVPIQAQTVGQTQTLGQITSVDVQDGDYVQAGQVLVVLDGQEALQSLNQASSSVASAQASYDELVDGPTAAQLASYQNAIVSAQNNLNNIEQDIVLKLEDDYTSVANAVYLNTDPYFNQPMTEDASLAVSSVTFTNQELENQVNTDRINSGAALAEWNDELGTLSTSSDLTTSINTALSDLNTLQTYFNDMTSLFASYSVSQSTDGQSIIDSDKDTASEAQNTVSSAISDLTSALQSYNQDQIDLQQAQTALSLETAAPDTNNVAIAQAQLQTAEANFISAQETYASRIITAPFAGQIGGLTAAIGQQVSSSDVLGEIITPQKVVDVTLNEVDAAKVQANDPVTLTFAALPNLTVDGTVQYVDPLATITSGVVNYTVSVVLNEQNSQIDSGMTATAVITTTTATDTLMIPSSAITTVGSKEYVLVDTATSSSTMHSAQGGFGSSTPNGASMYGMNGASSTMAMSSSTRRGQFGSSGANSSGIQFAVTPPVKMVEITTGISNDTETQVLSGLSAGELVVTSTISGPSSTPSAAAAATTRGTGGGSREGGAGGFGGAAAGTAFIGRE